MVEQYSPDRFRARGTRVMLPHGGLPEVIPPYLLDLIHKTGGADGPIGRQFVAQPELEGAHYQGELSDPLLEDEHEVAPGLVYKYRAGVDPEGFRYSGRTLFTITRLCAAYCRFCTRGREVGIPAGAENPLSGALSHTPHLSREQIDQSLSYIGQEEGLNEVILSGGDPLTVRVEVLGYVLGRLADMQASGKLSIVRIGTRVPIHNPPAIREGHFQAVAKVRNPRMMVHINHPAELTPQAVDVLQRFRVQCNSIIMSQTVLLRGVNDSPEVLYQLFTKIADEGFIPYYLFQNDPVYWARHFTVPIDEAINLWQQLRPRLSGVAATARFAIDTPNGYGKVAVPEGGAWDVNYTRGFMDFNKSIFYLK